jgi:phosphoribosylformimino-5-aminoimidazole carboxamide ribotide isomerase
MKVFPSLDLSKGKAMKRVRGVENTGLVLGDPVKLALTLFEEGYERLHVVDLDCAQDKGQNEEVIKQVASIGFKELQVGGGIRSLEKANRLLSYGVNRLVLSTLPFMNMREFLKIKRSLGGQNIAISLDYFGDKVLIKGWSESAYTLASALERVSHWDVYAVIFTCVNNEGLMSGVDRKLFRYAKNAKNKKGYAGGVKDLNDLCCLKNMGFDFAILGMSLYTGVLRSVKNV